MAQIDIYQYGEILGYPADGATAAENTAWIDEYAEYIGVSDTVYSTALMSAVRDGTTYKSTGNWIKRGVDAGKIVNWAESHDSYANEPSHGGWTKTLDQSVIDKAYALLAARADSQTLYLSRPSQTAHQSIYYGQKGSTHFTSKEIAEVNRFHNAMIGKDEKVLGASTYYAVLRSGGAVIVTKSSDIDVTVGNNGSMVPVGTYGDYFTCPNGKRLNHAYDGKRKTENGYEVVKSYYICESCESCPHREKCYKGKYENRKISFSKTMARQKAQAAERITADEGNILRRNRSIQVEGAFGIVKQDRDFRRFLTRGKAKTETQFFLIAFSFNINKLHNRTIYKRLGLELFNQEAA